MRTAILTVVSLAALAAADFHVSPSGNDAWSGTTRDAIGADGPFATLAKAQEAVRAFKLRSRRAGPITIELRGGRYELTKPLVFTVEDSGSAAVPIVWQAAPGETPVVSGGRVLGGWQVGADGRWTTTVAGVAEGFYPRQLTMNGERRYRPRLPKTDWFFIAGFAGADPNAKYDTPADRFEFKAGDIVPTWRNLTDIDVTVMHFWVDTHLPIAAVDAATRTVTFQKHSRRKLTDDYTGKGARYYLDNVAEGLSAPGEWYLDRPTGVLTYLPKAGETPEKTQAVVPVAERLLDVRGERGGTDGGGKPVEHLSFRGLTFSDTYWALPAKDAGDLQAANTVPGSIVLRHARHISFTDCRFVNLGTYGVELANGALDCRVEHCEFVDLAGGGLKLNGGGAGSPEHERCGRHVITDNHLHRLGQLYHSAVGVLSQHSFGNTIAHNHIHHLYYTAISAGWVWGYHDSVSRDNRIEANDIHDVGQKLLSDMGGIYLLGRQPGTVVRGNRIRDVDSWGYGGWGIYTDEGSSDILIEGNLVHRTKSGGFHQHYGKDNIVRGNIIALCREDQLQRTRTEPHRSFVFERNIVYFAPGMKLLGMNWKDDGFLMDHNCYWQAGGGAFKLAQWTWAEWQARGQDRNSLIADPLFVDPENGDFTLRPGSPAVNRLGFVPLDVSTIGPRRR
jgi:hypothetical protein